MDGMDVGMGVRASFEGGYRCRVAMRRFETVVDEPREVGGTDEGPQPTELLLASLASCFALAVAHVARKGGVELSGLEVRAGGEYEGLRFSRFGLEVRADCPRPQLEDLVRRARPYCYVSNTLAREPAIEVVVGGAAPRHPTPPEPV